VITRSGGCASSSSSSFWSCRQYGAAWNEEAIARRYGDQIGYWSFYVKTGAARVTGS